MMRDLLLNLILKILSVCLVLGVVVYMVGLSQHPDTMRVPPPLFAGVVALSVLVAMVIGRLETGADAFNGTGTMLYGHRDTGRGHAATKWLVFTWIPVVPLRSVEVPRGAHDGPDAWRPLPGVGLDWGQVLPPVLLVWGAAIGTFVTLLW